MSRFEWSDSYSKDLDAALYMSNYIKLKSKDERWKNFKPFVMTPEYLEKAEARKDATIYDDDVFVCSFPRSGTTLTQEIVWLIMNGFNFEAAKAEVLDDRVPEFEYGENLSHLRSGAPIDPLKVKRPRAMKTHFPVHMLPDQVWTVKPKLIYVSREVKDAAVSFYHLYTDVYQAKISMEDFFKAFMEDRVQYAPFREHRLDYIVWNIKDYDNILMITYEELVSDSAGSIRKIAAFLGKEATDENVQKLKEHVKLDSMKNNAAVNNLSLLTNLNNLLQTNSRLDTFVRKGLIGGHKEEMSEEYIKKFDEWMNEDIKSGWDTK